MPNIDISKLIPGQVIKEDIYTTRNQLVICKNTIATEHIIQRLQHFDIKQIPIYDKNENVINVEESTKIFKENYKNIENKLSSFLNNLIKKEYSNIQIYEIINETIALYNSQSSILMLIKMMQQMEQNDIIFAHSINVGILGMLIGKWCHFSEDDCKLILQCGIFHDIGKLLLPKNILNKNGKLTINEYAQVKSHTVEGYKLLKNLELNPEISNAALLHHERINGSGYPLQLSGTQIDKFSKLSKIIAIADTYDAMTSKRIYRDAICPFKVFSEFERNGIELYEPEYLISFLKNIVNSYLNEDVLLSNGQQGKIIMINNTSLGRPVIKSNNDFIDLARYRENELSIIEIL